MNKRIEELALECYQAPEFDYKKFAELIVRECAHIGFNAAYPDKGVAVLTAIKEHFGAEG